MVSVERCQREQERSLIALAGIRGSHVLFFIRLAQSAASYGSVAVSWREATPPRGFCYHENAVLLASPIT